jgi:hypothetical protein
MTSTFSAICLKQRMCWQTHLRRRPCRRSPQQHQQSIRPITVSQGPLVGLSLLAHLFVFVHTLQRACRSAGTIHRHGFGHRAPHLFLTFLRLRLLSNVSRASGAILANLMASSLPAFWPFAALFELSPMQPHLTIVRAPHRTRPAEPVSQTLQLCNRDQRSVLSSTQYHFARNQHECLA